MTGEIDLSVASMLGLSGTLLGYLLQHGWTIWPAMLAALVVGARRRRAQRRAGHQARAAVDRRHHRHADPVPRPRRDASARHPTRSTGSSRLSLTKIGVATRSRAPSSSWSVAIFIVLAVIFAVVLHATPLGRSIFAIGLQPEAAQFAGIRVNRIKFWLYVLSAACVCAFAGHPVHPPERVGALRRRHRPGAQRRRHRAVRRRVDLRRPRQRSSASCCPSPSSAACRGADPDQRLDRRSRTSSPAGCCSISVIVPNGAEALRRVRDAHDGPTPRPSRDVDSPTRSPPTPLHPTERKGIP